MNENQNVNFNNLNPETTPALNINEFQPVEPQNLTPSTENGAIEPLEVKSLENPNTVSQAGNNIPDRFLPIGTVVTLKEAIKSLMIIGYCPVTENNELYDYCAVLVPEGLLESNKFLVFNHEVVEKVNFLGLENDEQKKWDDNVKATLERTQMAKPFEKPVDNKGQELNAAVVEINDQNNAN